MSAGEIILRTDGVGKSFGKFTALKAVSAEFRRGAITAIIGPNGAGKSTYFNLLCGAFRPSTGRVEFEGRDVTGLPQHRFAHMGVAKSFQITNVFPQLSTHENIRVAAQARVARFDIWRPRARLTELGDEADAILERVGLWDRRERVAGALAHGEQRALEIGMALASRPRLLLLDEPTAGMSPEETRVMMELIVKLAEERTVILVEHKMKLVMGISDRLLVLHHGELLAEGTPDDIRRNETVKRVYLGQREH
ncbi:MULTISPECIES: ABC transporter ATP-binding protein [Rhodomicrobium]|uniref:ABC transporter ATP-binding protein n=1 Tax=Rhodomicrobium TaxID=1068 RepID=UPI000B4B3FF5|nr:MULTISPECIES: ABC transporter ATP-binding protein [Rhodomicrobium]